LMAFQYFTNLLCCLLQRVCASIAEMSVLDDLLGPFFTGNRHARGLHFRGRRRGQTLTAVLIVSCVAPCVTVPFA
jgi:hypothetical protein